MACALRTSLLVVAATAVLAGCAQAAPPQPSTATITEGGVEVTAVLRGGDDGHGELTVTFAPLEPGFHVYSTTHDSAASRGLGFRTSVLLLEGPVVSGPWRADAPVERLEFPSLETSVEVFPNGPVRLTAPVYRVHEGSAVLSVSYAACSEALCLPPVLDRRLALEWPTGR